MKPSDKALLVFGAGGVLLALAMLAAPLLPKPDTSGMKVAELAIQLASAIGSLAAALVALHIANRGRRDADVVERNLAMITAAACLPRLVATERLIAPVVSNLAFDPDLSAVSRCDRILRCAERLQLTRFDVDYAELARLVVLPDSIAGRIGATQGELERLCNECDGVRPHFGLLHQEALAYHGLEWEALLSKAHVELRALIHQLESYSAQATTWHPDYGDANDE